MDQAGRMWGRVFGLLFLAVVIGAVTLLIAGYGVPVGLGALAGLILGAVAGLLGVLWLMRGFGRSVNVAGMQWSSYDFGEGGGERQQVELMAEVQEMSEVMGIDLGRIRSVRPVLQAVEAGSLTVQLVTIEEREAGLSMTLDVRAGLGVSPPASVARVIMTDDVGTTYRASAQGQGGWPMAMRYQVAAIPAVPPTATRLDIAIERFMDPFPGSRGRAVGPWAFSVPLDPRELDSPDG
jgi:hypothetical protein